MDLTRRRASRNRQREQVQAGQIFALLGFGVAVFALGRASVPNCDQAMQIRATELILCRQAQSQGMRVS